MISRKKMYYSIKEVCEITDLKQHVLRYWESKFSSLKPKKNRAGNRAYREKDIRIIQEIKHLLYEEKLTISGAIKKLESAGLKQSAGITEKRVAKKSSGEKSKATFSGDLEQQSLFEVTPNNSTTIDESIIAELKEVLKIISI